MRTTVTLDPDVEALVKRRMREERVGFKKAVNDGLRRGLAGGTRREVSFPTYDMGKPKIDLTKALQIAAELDNQEIMRTMPRRRQTKRRTSA